MHTGKTQGFPREVLGLLIRFSEFFFIYLIMHRF